MSIDVGLEEIVIGTGDDSLLTVPDDCYMSRRHARVFRDSGLTFLEDLHSSNGTFLRVRRLIAIEDGDEIVLGTTILQVQRVS